MVKGFNEAWRAFCQGEYYPSGHFSQRDNFLPKSSGLTFFRPILHDLLQVLPQFFTKAIQILNRNNIANKHTTAPTSSKPCLTRSGMIPSIKDHRPVRPAPERGSGAEMGQRRFHRRAAHDQAHRFQGHDNSLQGQDQEQLQPPIFPLIARGKGYLYPSKNRGSNQPKALRRGLRGK